MARLDDQPEKNIRPRPRPSLGRRASAAPTPKDVDALTWSGDVTLGALRGAIPRRLFTPSEARSLVALARVLGTVALLGFLTSRVELRAAAGWALFIALTLAQGCAVVGLFVLGHDAGHGAFSRSRTVNQIVGHLAMAPLMTTLKSWQLFHDHHHRWPQKHGAQHDFLGYLVTREGLRGAGGLSRLGYRLPGGFLLWILGGIARRATLARSIPALVRGPREARQLRVSAAVTWAIVLAIWTVLAWLGGPLAIVKYHLAPVLVSTLIGSLLVTVQHSNMESLFYPEETWSPLRGQLVSTFDVRFPRLLEWLWCDINIHIPHHVSPRIPWYNLRAAAAALKTALPAGYQERHLGKSELSFLWRVPFLKPVPERGYLELERGEP